MEGVDDCVRRRGETALSRCFFYKRLLTGQKDLINEDEENRYCKIRRNDCKNLHAIG